MTTKLRAALGLLVLGAAATPASACVTIGVYQDNPTSQLSPFVRSVGPGVTALSTYVTGGTLVDPSLIALANRRHLTLVVAWLPDSGSDTSPNQPHFRLTNIIRGNYDQSLRALAAQLRGLKRPAILRPMPEPNTPWYAWSGLVNHNTPAAYRQAWLHIRTVVRAAAGRRIRLLWTPFSQSVPPTAKNAFASYFPGAKNVDLVGADNYNFGQTASQVWQTPTDLFSAAYAKIEALARKPFWLGETGSTSIGGSQADWITSLTALPQHMPRLAGVIWFDTLDPANGDFRVTTPTARYAFRGLLHGSCR